MGNKRSVYNCKEYVKARYLFLQAYNSFVSAGQTDNAVKCAVNTASLYHRENYYKEAFEVLSRLDGILSETESAKATPRPDLHYPIHKERGLGLFHKLIPFALGVGGGDSKCNQNKDSV